MFSDEDLGRLLLDSFNEENTNGRYMNWHSTPENSMDTKDADIVEGRLEVCLDDWFDFIKIAKIFVGKLEEGL